MTRRLGIALTLLLALTASAGACGGSSAPATPTSPSPSPTPVALTVQGDPESSQGATWTYRGTIEGVAFDLQGVLLKPRGAGPWPAVIISHGTGGNATGYSRAVASEMVQWGLVCIATNYTHAGGVPLGAPGSAADLGASQANVLRAHAAYEILRSLGYVDINRVAAHGHSMGAFVTAAVAAGYPNDFRAVSHTAGGVRPDGSTGVAPLESQARDIRRPYQMHHGDADVVVPLAMDQRLASALSAGGVPHDLHVYPGVDHNDISRSAAMFSRVRAWYAAHGVF